MFTRVTEALTITGLSTKYLDTFKLRKLNDSNVNVCLKYPSLRRSLEQAFTGEEEDLTLFVDAFSNLNTIGENTSSNNMEVDHGSESHPGPGPDQAPIQIPEKHDADDAQTVGSLASGALSHIPRLRKREVDAENNEIVTATSLDSPQPHKNLPETGEGKNEDVSELPSLTPIRILPAPKPKPKPVENLLTTVAVPESEPEPEPTQNEIGAPRQHSSELWLTGAPEPDDDDGFCILTNDNPDNTISAPFPSDLPAEKKVDTTSTELGEPAALSNENFTTVSVTDFKINPEPEPEPEPKPEPEPEVDTVNKCLEAYDESMQKSRKECPRAFFIERELNQAYESAKICAFEVFDALSKIQTEAESERIELKTELSQLITELFASKSADNLKVRHTTVKDAIQKIEANSSTAMTEAIKKASTGHDDFVTEETLENIVCKDFNWDALLDRNRKMFLEKLLLNSFDDLTEEEKENFKNATSSEDEASFRLLNQLNRSTAETQLTSMIRELTANYKSEMENAMKLKYWIPEDIKKLDVKLQAQAEAVFRTKYLNSLLSPEGKYRLIQSIQTEKEAMGFKELVERQKDKFLSACSLHVSDLVKVYTDKMERQRCESEKIADGEQEEMQMSTATSHEKEKQSVMERLQKYEFYKRLSPTETEDLLAELSTRINSAYIELFDKWHPRQEAEPIDSYDTTRLPPPPPPKPRSKPASLTTSEPETIDTVDENTEESELETENKYSSHAQVWPVPEPELEPNNTETENDDEALLFPEAVSAQFNFLLPVLLSIVIAIWFCLNAGTN